MVWEHQTIPPEYRDTAKIEIAMGNGYEGDHYVHIGISYFRPETNKEIATRKANEKRRKEIVKEDDLRMLAALKAKYGE